MGIFETYIYQPFFNILVGLYWVVGQFMPTPDMGIAVILFAVAVRVILLPIDLASSKSDKEKFEIAQKINRVKKEFSHDPVRLAAETKKIMRESPGAIVSEVIGVIIQFIIILMLYRIFSTGLEGADMHLLYSFMPQIQEPINLLFLGKYDLSHTNNTLNIIQSIMIAINEIFHLYFSPVKPNRKDLISLVIIFPICCFILFMFLPAGKKVFIITTLAFSMVRRLIGQAMYLLYSFSHHPVVPTPDANTDEATSPPASHPGV